MLFFPEMVTAKNSKIGQCLLKLPYHKLGGVLFVSCYTNATVLLTTYTSQARDQKHFTMSEVVDNWRELVIGKVLTVKRC